MTQDRQTTLLAALAGLLHDIGKFAGRAEVGAMRTWDQEAQREYRYKHALLSDDFVARYVPVSWRPTVRSAVGNHHRPQSAAERLVTLADRLAAAERIRDGRVVEDDAGDDDAPRLKHPKQLETIFRRLHTDDAPALDGGVFAPSAPYLPLEPLAIRREVIFPGQALSDIDTWRAYDQMWQAFTQEADVLRAAHEPDGDAAIYLESLLLLMQQYTWCIPSAYFNATPDISLYDHSRMTGALAAVLARSQLSDDAVQNWLRNGVPDSQPIALLVGGDLSGVQQFIYTITARGATPALRGRSFYLQMLTEVVVRYLLEQFGLPSTNVIYAGGGNFYLLAAPEDAARLPDLRAAVSRILLDHHQGDLYLALAARPLNAADLQGERLGEAWGDLHRRFHAFKQRRFSELGAELSDLFVVPGSGGNADHLCRVCGREHPDTTPDAKAGDEEEPPLKCRPCRSYETLGDKLRRARYLQLIRVSPDSGRPTQAGGYDEVLAAFGYQIEPIERLEELQDGDVRAAVLALDDEARVDLRPLSKRAIGRKLLVNTTPILTQSEIDDLKANGFDDDLPIAGSVKPFSVLAHQSCGIKRLGVLRMDMDNLGHIFSHGLGERASLSRIASLSFAVSLYFEGWVAQLAAQQAPRRTKEREYTDRLYAIYSGGDDLFFVGAWDAVVELAAAARRDLTAYAAGHPGLHASAGLSLVTQKYPLYQAAQNAGDAENAAKALVWQKRRKDAVCFLGQALPWSQFGLDAQADFLSAALPLAYFLAKEGADRQPLIRRLSGLHAQYAEAEEKRRKAGQDRASNGEPQPLFGPWMYRAAYTLTRLAKSQSADADRITALRDRLQADQFQTMPWIGLAARWADLLIR